jgi:class 3 adenylate cyclase/predicted ATPase
MLPLVIVLLQHEKRVTYRALKRDFGFDDAFIAELRDELAFKQLARDEDGQGLVWIGDSQPLTYADAARLGRLTSEAAAPPGTAADDLGTASSADTSRIANAERRQVTVMFCDLVDSTQLSQQLDPEDYRAVVRAYQETAAAAIQPYDGYIAQYLGDGILAYFGWPQAHEDAAARAVHGSLTIIEQIAPLNERLQPQYGIQTAVRIGLHTGLAVVGEMGSGDRHEQLAMGDTANIASRLQGLATSNSIALSAATARLLHDDFTLEERGVHHLKGVAEPVSVFRVVEVTESLVDDDSFAFAPPFLVGRDEEIGLLRRRWLQAREGLGQVVLINGEAGIGKSSLVETLRAQAQAEGFTRVAYRCSPYHTNSALYPVIEHVQRALNVDRGDTPATKLTRLEQRLAGFRLPLEEAVPLLAALLAIPLPENRYPTLSLTPQQQRQQTHDTLVAWLLEEAERQPMLVVWEDLHWADPSTLEALGLLIEQVPTAPMLHLLTFRPDFTPPWPTRSHITPITLNRLERPQAEALIDHLAAGTMLPETVIEHIVAKTDGVPLFVEELTKMVLESDLMRQPGDPDELGGSLATLAIPDTLQDSLMARLDQHQNAKEVAQLGAVIGREFTYDMLQTIAAQDEVTLQDGLDRLAAAELLYRRGRPPRARYMFKHALIQDAAYASLLKRTRQQIHQQIAERLEKQFPEIVAVQPELVAHHYTQAELGKQAVAYWQQAGEQARERSAHAETVSHLSRGLEVLHTLPDTLERGRQELSMQIPLVNTYMATRGWDASEVEDTYRRARELCEQTGETSQLFPVLYGLCANAFMQLKLQRAREIGEEFLQLTQSQDDPEPQLVAHRVLGTTLNMHGELSLARAHLEQAVALYDPQRHRALALRYGQDPGMAGLSFLARTLWALGYPDQAWQKSCEALELARELAHPFSLAYALASRIFVLINARDVTAVQEAAEELTALSAKHGFTPYLAFAAVGRGWSMVMQGQVEAGIDRIRQASPTTRIRPHALAILADAYSRIGQADAGLALVDEALDLVKGGYLNSAELQRLKGELLLGQSLHNREQAEACFQRAIDIAQRQAAKSWELQAAMSLSRLWQQQGKQIEARCLLADVYNWFTEGFTTADLKVAKTLLETLDG